MRNRLIITLSHDLLPFVRDRYPFVYLEHGRLEVDDSSVKWISSLGEVIRIPAGTIGTILLGPGTSITHEAVKALSMIKTTVCWVGEESLYFYAVGKSPVEDTIAMKKQAELSLDPDKRLIVAKRMFQQRFTNTDLSNTSLSQLMGMEGKRVRETYQEMAEKYGVVWYGRSFTPGDFKLSDTTNSYLTAANQFLYAVCLSAIISLGYSPYFGFVHSGSPLPFVYDMADLYKKDICIELAFQLTKKHYGKYDPKSVKDEFCKMAVEYELMKKLPRDIGKLFGELK